MEGTRASGQRLERRPRRRSGGASTAGDREPSASPAGEPSVEARLTEVEARSIGRRARGLGWFSIGLGLAELAAPRALSRMIGLPGGPRTRWALRLCGLRELGAGLGILGSARPKSWLGSRVAGDGIDLVLLTTALAVSPRRSIGPGRLSGALAAVAGVTALDVLTGRQLARAEREGTPTTTAEPVSVSGAVTVNRPPAEVFAFWRELGNLARFMSNVRRVDILDDRRSRWTVDVAGKTVEWEAEITGESAPGSIAWQTRERAGIAHRGEVNFRPGPRGEGTEVRVRVDVTPPAGWFGRLAARTVRIVPEQQLALDLARLKQVLEIGEIMRSDASIHRGPHPARPSAPSERKADQ
jgi:uncharacterized membrane protein